VRSHSSACLFAQAKTGYRRHIHGIGGSIANDRGGGKLEMKTRYVFKGTTVWRPGEPECSFEMDGEDLERSFRRVFHREMTPQEKRFFHLAEKLLRGENRKEAAAMSCSAAEPETI